MMHGTTCKACGAPIRFVLTAKGKLSPISLETGVSHFIDCEYRDRFRRPRSLKVLTKVVDPLEGG